ncbi:maltokinase N-terminal cap-like domain-containing protein [Streptomyces sp. SAJ15]|uniref:maltokinase N-terminal cap-like domain-containing protein n=1 Tax=Streptomyces sp. SAJ15 TaxID=2011095 RepID=UPI001186A47E|nr:phosphotransferase [Streptomyces sp. SAJ15]TVL94230.1 maltokinase [Streptomyces sp. SAJ15]
MPEAPFARRTPHASAGVPHAAGAPGARAPGGLLPSLAPLLARWLPRQRWFAGKGRPITGFALVSAAELLPCAAGGATPGLLHLLVRAEQPGTPAGGPGADCYQILLGVRSTLPPLLAPALVGRPAGGPLDGQTVYEALYDPRLATLLLERLRVPGRLGPLRFAREPATSMPSVLTPRLITAEQSNSSVVYGEAYILKIFRRVSPGVNPDLELPLALARTGCARVPSPTAWFETVPAGADSAPFTLGVLQPYLAGSTDGWQLALRALARHADFAPAAHALGRATAEVHLAMAQALPTVILRRPQIDTLVAAMTERLNAAASAVPALHPYRAALRAAFDDLAALGRAGHCWAAQRIHGDLHLGQVLRAADDGPWSLIDFEGEPSRPLAERRRPQPAVRDVAGMLRSFDYAAAVASRTRATEHGGGATAPRTGPRAGGGTGEPGGRGDAPAAEWALRTRAAFCAGYAQASGADPRDAPELLRAYETDKAIYEVLYEARHRPDWLSVPMSAIRRLAGVPRTARGT